MIQINKFTAIYERTPRKVPEKFRSIEESGLKQKETVEPLEPRRIGFDFGFAGVVVDRNLKSGTITNTFTHNLVKLKFHLTTFQTHCYVERCTGTHFAF